MQVDVGDKPGQGVKLKELVNDASRKVMKGKKEDEPTKRIGMRSQKPSPRKYAGSELTCLRLWSSKELPAR